MDDANLPITGASIFNPTPTSVDFSLSANLKVPISGVTVDLKPITLALFTPEIGAADPYLRLSLPEYHLKGEAIISVTNQTAVILDEPQFETFLGSAVASKNFTISADGTTYAYLGALKAKVRLNKQIEMPGQSSIITARFSLY